MAGYFKKRRGGGPSKNEQKLQRAELAERAVRHSGLVASRFPSVRRLRLQLDFTDAQGHLLESRALAMASEDAAALVVPCPGRCGHGSFDLGTGVARAVEAGETAAECGGNCPAGLYGSADACGCALRCRIAIEYRVVAPAA